MLRIGHGFDFHKFGGKGPLIVGGITVPCERGGLLAHSDGDIVMHALCDALLGATADGDLGKHFSDRDRRWKGIDSRELLKEVYRRVTGKNYYLGNTDITVIAQEPKIAPYARSMREVIAGDLDVEASCINIKATTLEGLGCIGRKEGIACESVVLLLKRDQLWS